MVFKCQEDSFLKEFSSEVVSCAPIKFETLVDGKKAKVEGYAVICKDTILFPEGGGQPYDQGFLNDKKVHQVIRKGDQALHYVTEPLNAGEVVNQSVDWDRRFENMQQHSGQHLVSAITEREFGFNTLSWWMGEEDSYIELDVPTVTQDQIIKTEQVVNELIRACTKVSVEIYTKDTSEELLAQARSAKGLPEDHTGDIRVITIHGVESNMCCGTHVNNLSQLQVIKILHCEKSKRKNQCLLHFLVGNRVLNRLDQSIQREQKITTILNNGPYQHVELIDKLSKHSKLTNKYLQTVLKELALLEVEKIKQLSPKPQYYSLHRKEAEPDFMNIIVREIGNTDIFLFLSTGDEKGAGNIVLYGSEICIGDLGIKVSELLAGKGAGKGNRFQAKVSNLSNRSKVEELLKEYFK